MVARGPLDVDPDRIGVAESVVETHLEDARVEKIAQFRGSEGFSPINHVTDTYRDSPVDRSSEEVWLRLTRISTHTSPREARETFGRSRFGNSPTAPPSRPGQARLGSAERTIEVDGSPWHPFRGASLTGTAEDSET